MANDVPHFVLAERNGGRLEVSKVVIKSGNDHLRLPRSCRGPSVLYVGGAYAGDSWIHGIRDRLSILWADRHAQSYIEIFVDQRIRCTDHSRI
jgi:hypothetical protein